MQKVGLGDLSSFIDNQLTNGKEKEKKLLLFV